jgi:lipopolysaccharide transport system permease protein
MQVAFFLTPVMWLPSALTGRLAFLLEILNPFASFLAVIRDPLLGQTPPLASWAIVLAITVPGWGLAFAMFARFRSRITYWL